MTVIEGPWEGATISGTISLPAGVKARKVSVWAWASDGCFGVEPCCCEEAIDGEIDASGAFAVQGLSAGRRYHVGLEVTGHKVIGGYYAGEGRALAEWESDGVPVAAPGDGLLLAARVAVAISGSVELPVGVRRKDVDVTLEQVVAPDAAGSTSISESLRKDRSFVARGLERGTTYRIRVSGDGHRRFDGYYTGAGPLSPSIDDALLVTAPADITVRAVDIASLPR